MNANKEKRKTIPKIIIVLITFDIDLNLTKKEVEQLRKTLKAFLDAEREEMKLKWIDSITQ